MLFHLNVFSLGTLFFFGERYIVFPQGGMGTSKISRMGLESKAIWGGMGKQKKRIKGGRCKFGVLLDKPWEALMGGFY